MDQDYFGAFICHASEDKEAVVRALAQSLSDAGLHIWYDEFSLKLGDSLRQSIEHGLSKSKYGVVVLSPSFFEKNWPQAELDGLFAKEMAYGKTIIPIWHEITKADVLKVAPILADKVAARTSDGLDRVIEQLLEVLDPNRLHLSKACRLVTAAPKSFRLNIGGWKVKTSVTVSNQSGVAVYAACLKIIVQNHHVKSESVQIETSGQGSAIGGNLGEISVHGDVVIQDCVDQKGREALLVLFHVIPPRQTREIIVIGQTPIDSSASLEIADFKLEPMRVLEKEGQIAFSFQPPENVTVKGIRLALRRA